jgi:hypothetical protein
VSYVFKETQLHVDKVAEKLGRRLFAAPRRVLLKMMSKITPRNSNVVPDDVPLILIDLKMEAVLYEAIIGEIGCEWPLLGFSTCVIRKEVVLPSKFGFTSVLNSTVSTLPVDILFFLESFQDLFDKLVIEITGV